MSRCLRSADGLSASRAIAGLTHNARRSWKAWAEATLAGMDQQPYAPAASSRPQTCTPLFGAWPEPPLRTQRGFAGMLSPRRSEFAFVDGIVDKGQAHADLQRRPRVVEMVALLEGTTVHNHPCCLVHRRRRVCMHACTQMPCKSTSGQGEPEPACSDVRNHH